jgi:hypothetical protein
MTRRRPWIRPRRERSPLSDGPPNEEDPEQLVPNLQVAAGAEGGNARNPLENPSGERTEPLRQNLEMPRNPEVLINQGALGGAPVPRPRAQNRHASAPPQNVQPQGNPPLNVQDQEAAREEFERVANGRL